MTKTTKLIITMGSIVSVIGLILLFNKQTAIKETKNYLMINKIFDKNNEEIDEKSVQSPENYFGQLTFIGGEPNSKDLAQAIMCADQVNEIEKVDLYMPDMGHGSQPPQVSPYNEVPEELATKAKENPFFGCIHISQMQLYMPGLWQVRVFYKDGTVGLFSLNLAE